MAEKEAPNQEQMRVYNPDTGECKRFPVGEIPGGWTRDDPNAEKAEPEKKEKKEKKKKTE